MRRTKPPFDGKRYVGDRRVMVVHDLDHEAGGLRGCCVDRIPLADVVTFEPDILHQAYRQGFTFCPNCIAEG
jgi:hypothetical protein